MGPAALSIERMMTAEQPFGGTSRIERFDGGRNGTVAFQPWSQRFELFAKAKRVKNAAGKDVSIWTALAPLALPASGGAVEEPAAAAISADADVENSAMYELAERLSGDVLESIHGMSARQALASITRRYAGTTLQHRAVLTASPPPPGEGRRP